MARRDEQREPSAQARSMARTCRDQYDALRAEGFTDPQALMLIGEMMAAAAISGADDDDET